MAETCWKLFRVVTMITYVKIKIGIVSPIRHIYCYTFMYQYFLLYNNIHENMHCDKICSKRSMVEGGTKGSKINFQKIDNSL